MKLLSVSLLISLGLSAAATAGDVAELVGRTFAARDTLGDIDDASADARECLKHHHWPAAEFQVECETGEDKPGDLIVRYPSPIDTGDAVNDRVAMEWYVARDESLRPIKAPAVVVVHESGKRMEVGRMFARGLRANGLHALMIQLPDYGYRRGDDKKDEVANVIVRMRQGIADVRRARDAVAALPLVDADHIALQGTSLGGFVAANAGAIDDAYDGVFLMLAGGQLHELIANGQKEAAEVRERLKAAGITGERLEAILWAVEPTRIAHRLSPERTWLYSGTHDAVVPIKNAEALATAAKLDPSHHIRFNANHYTGVVFFPMVLSHIRKQIP